MLYCLTYRLGWAGWLDARLLGRLTEGNDVGGLLRLRG
jgi:hypothetical protein